MSEFLDRYIEGEPGAYFFCIEILWGRDISGGQFHHKQDARDDLRMKLITFLDDPETLLRVKKKARENS